ncbi:GMC oxidoreductase [Xylariomycetidae sp. FL2044]|nr:GMC oxidoreductase [Xylariomycetidae sp. FL2044]
MKPPPTLKLALCAGILAITPSRADTADYVIVGAGPCGLLLANRLSADPDVTVTIVEPGCDQRENSNVVDPDGWQVLIGSGIDWKYNSVNQPGAGNRTIGFHAGKAIGGTSTINGMIYIRGDAAQFDAWESALGNEGWNWATLLEHYQQIEGLIAPEPWQTAAGAAYDSTLHGSGGELRVGFSPSLVNGTMHELARATWANLSLPRNEDANGGHTTGFTVFPQTIDPTTNSRWDAATAFYWPIVDQRPNLNLVEGSVRRIVWSGADDDDETEIPAVATGVEYLDADGNTVVLEARREVILSAGALRSPPILEMSGVGNPAILERFNITVKVDLPGVGENFQEQPIATVAALSSYEESGFLPYATFADAEALFGQQLPAVAAAVEANIAGWASDMAAGSSGGVDAGALEQVLRIQYDLLFNKGVSMAEIIGNDARPFMAFSIWPLMPFSRGSVHIGSATVDNDNVVDINNPAIDPKFMHVDFDLDTLVALAKLSQLFFGTEPVSDIITSQLTPNLPSTATDAEWKANMRASFGSNSHSMGSAAMMSRELGGVVDPALKVYGTENVRVVDASVIPMQFSGHLTATLYAIANKAAGIIMNSTQT